MRRNPEIYESNHVDLQRLVELELQEKMPDSIE
jgi:hypothetical protein